MSFRMYLCPNGQKHIVRITGKIRRYKYNYAGSDNYRVVDISTGKTGIVSGMFLRRTTSKDW